jgi:uncharacterized XkdX family phage protein
MDWFKICTDYYNAGYYDNISLKTFVLKGKITEADYQNITGIAYVA